MGPSLRMRAAAASQRAHTSLNSCSIFTREARRRGHAERRRQRLSKGRHHAPPFVVIEAELLPVIILEALLRI